MVKNETQLFIDENNCLVPDLMIFGRETNKNAPLLVIEILSKSTRFKDLGIKMEKYAEIGVSEYWVVDTKHFSIDVYLLSDKKTYSFFKSYVYYTDEDFSKIPKIREEQKSEIEIIEEFFPLSFPEMRILLEDVFYFIKGK
jgi:Uma2 family endonuclease